MCGWWHHRLKNDFNKWAHTVENQNQASAHKKIEVDWRKVVNR